MRDISQYAEEYAEAPFEPHQLKYWQKKLLERLARYPHGRILSKAQDILNKLKNK